MERTHEEFIEYLKTVEFEIKNFGGTATPDCVQKTYIVYVHKFPYIYNFYYNPKQERWVTGSSIHV